MGIESDRRVHDADRAGSAGALAHVLAVKRLRLMLSGTALLVSAVLIVIAGVLVATSR